MTATDTTTATPEIDPARVEAFAGRMAGAYNDAMLTVQVSLGHRTGLLDQLAQLGDTTSAGLAEAAGCDERYVREWLATLVTGGIVDRDRATDTYRLPAEHAAVLTRAAGIDNLAAFAQLVPLLAGVHDKIEGCFRHGGGLGYEHFEAFHEVMAELSAGVNDHRLLDVTLPLVEGLPARLDAGIDVLDVGCGSGHAINLMAGRYPASRFRGIDFSAPAVEAARTEARELGLANATFDLTDAVTLDAVDAYDLVTTFDAVHDQAHPQQVLDAIARALRPAGTYLAVDIAGASDVSDNLDHPLGPYFYGVSTLHCMTVSLADGGDGLGTLWGEQLAQEMLARAGFDDVRVEHVDGDIVNAYFVCRKT